MGLFMFIIILIMSGCASSNDGGKDNNSEVEEVTLKVRFGPDEDFIKSFIEPAEEEFDHITFELVDGDLEDLIVADNIPDILFHWGNEEYDHISEYELNYDLTELIEKVDFDLERFDENHLHEWRARSADLELWGLPLSTYRHQLVYNKDIFDQFGAEYPHDGMTWDEIVDLASEVTGERNGVEYQGLYMPRSGAPFKWNAGDLYDPETDEPLWTDNDQVKEYFELYKRTYSIPGNDYIAEHWEEDGWPELFDQGVLAMAPNWLFHPNPELNIDWDIATYPGPNTDTPGAGWGMSITAPSENKEAAMEVFKFWYSDEELLENPFISPIVLPYQHLYDDGRAQDAINDRLGDVYEGKNIDALFTTEVAEPKEKISRYESDEAIDEALYEYANEDIDLNTLLREKYEEEVARIEEEKGRD